jgi:DNA topoisomerase-3
VKVCIAEKPSVAREIARILQANSRKDGYFEGNGYQVSWTFGHLCTLKNPNDYTAAWKPWRMDSLPMIPSRFGIKLIENNGVEKQFNTIKKLVNECDEVINCGDAGIEGELIQRWVLTLSGSTKPLKRLWISSMTDEAIKEGFEKLKDGKDFDRLYAAGNARAIGDWLLGMNASRLYTLKFANGKGVLSVGRVQTPTLALIVSRFEEIQNFVSVPFWEIKTKYRDVDFHSTTRRFEKIEEAQKILDDIKESELEILSFTQKKGKEAPPKLFDLTALQVECNKKFGFTADQTLKYTQNLYEKKMLTYPRVDTTFLPNDMYPKIGGILKKMAPYANYTAVLLQSKIKKSKKVFDDKKITDHHAIVPTGVQPSGLILEEKRVYDLVARRFIAAFYPDCVVSNTTVEAKVKTHKFKATGKVIVDDGWRVVFNANDNSSEAKNTDKQDQIMPKFEKGEKGTHVPELLEKQTQPPKLFTEATLLRAMETAGKQVDDEELRELMKDNGIGRPSTRANIIETLFKRKFVTRQRKNLVPTPTGIALIHTIQNELLKSAELTGLWEKKLRLIEKGEYDAKNFLDEMKQMVAQLVQEVKRESYKAIEVEQDDPSKEKSKNQKQKPKVVKKNTSKRKDTPVLEQQVICPKCKKGNIIKGNKAYGCSAYKTGCDFTVSFKIFDPSLSHQQILDLIQKGDFPN